MPFLLTASAQSTNGVIGFATYADLGLQGVTGGGAEGTIIHVGTREAFIDAVAGNTPRIVIVDNDITGYGMEDRNDEVSLGSNLTILGADEGKALNGICLDVNDQQNIIIRNIILTKGRTDGLSFRNCHHVWIDHCDLSDSYDGLLDFTLGSDYLTVSWTKLHNHDKVSITNSGTCHYEDYGKEKVTFSHCWFSNNTQRNPRIGYGLMHIYNCYWTDISSYCIGFHSQAQVLSEYNYFTKSAKNPFNNQYSDVLPYCGYLTDNGSYFANGNPGTGYSHPFTGITYTPKTYYDFEFDQSAVDKVPDEISGIGPKPNLMYEPILCPGNGAIQVPVTQKLSWGKVDAASQYRLYIGTSKDNLSEADVSTVVLQPSTTYYWKVVAVVNGNDCPSPVYMFSTASEQASNPYPEQGAKNPWLRWPSARDQFCTSMPLQWRPAADAKLYKVYVGKSETEMSLVGETSSLSLVPDYKFKTAGDTYYWRVDVVKHDETTVTGEVWNFKPAKSLLVEFENETADMYLSGIAFAETVSNFEGKAGVRGDQGPGSIIGVWDDAAGRYAIETITYDQPTGPNLVGIFINDKLVDSWLTSSDNYVLNRRRTRHTVNLNPGDEIRVDFVAGYVNGALNQSVGHIDEIVFESTTKEIIDVKRPSGVHHSPSASKGFEYENLPLTEILFRDSLGTVGDYDSMQIKDMYCSWISMDDAKYTLYLANTSMMKLVYENGEETISLEKTAKHAQEILKQSEKGALKAIHLYKSLPSKTVYHTPEPASGSSCELLRSPDCIFIDSKGEIGEPNKGQIRAGYDEWMKYHNPTAYEVMVKNTVPAFINPETDAAMRGTVIRGKDNSSYSYCVGTDKYMTYFVKECSSMKFYYTGTAGAASNLFVEALDINNPSATDIVYGDNALGKNVASNSVDIVLDPSKTYQVKIQATTGDMLIYAVKLWLGGSTGISHLEESESSVSKIYNLSGQQVSAAYKGIVIKGGVKTICR